MRRTLLFSLMCAVVGMFAGLTVGGAPRAEAVDASVVIDGHGWGHGVGLSQWGAYGYAVDHGWSSAQILNHYYGGTVAGTVPLDSTVTVRLQALDGSQTAVVSATGGLQADGVAGGGSWKSVLVREVAAGVYALWARSDAEVCPSATADPTGTGWSLIAASLPGSVTIRSRANSLTTTSFSDLLGVCSPTGSLRAYRGAIRAVNDSMGNNRTVNEVAVEQYLRSVVAKEVSPSWATAGGGKGAQALQAQAVAARSYGLAENRYSPWARTCDTTSCQAYYGAATRSSTAAGWTAVEHASTDAAVLATAGVVRRVGLAAGPVAYTMFSASSGGWTAPGSGGTGPFPAVVDEGDDTSGNPNYNWSVTIAGSKIAADLVKAGRGDIGSYVSMSVLARNGFGDWGGRVTRVTVVGTLRTIEITGDQFRSAVGLKSNWFAIRAATTPTLPPPDPCAGRTAPAVGAPLPTAPAARFTPLDEPTRIVDTRVGHGTTAMPLLAKCTLRIDPALPAGTTAVVVNLTAVNSLSGGFVTAWPCGVERPTASAVQAMPGRAVAGATAVRLGLDGSFCVYSHVTIDLVVDLLGSYAVGGAWKFEPIIPVRVLDTRSGVSVSPATGPAVVSMRAGRPSLAGATAVAVTVQAIGGSANGFATVYPCDRPRPTASTINVAAGVASTNQAQVALSASGELCVATNTAMHVVLDVSGWFGAGATTEYRAITPVRVLDTRPSGSATDRVVKAGELRAVPLAGVAGLPEAAAVRAFAAGVTAVASPVAGQLLVDACVSRTTPLNTVRFPAGSNSATLVVNSDSTIGAWCLRASTDVHVVVDVSGYFG